MRLMYRWLTATLVLGLVLVPSRALAQSPAPPATSGVLQHAVVTPAVHHDVSPPLRTLKGAPRVHQIAGARPLRRIPRPPSGGKTASIGTSGTLTHATGVTLGVYSAGDVTNGGFETGDFTGWATSGTTSVVTSRHSGSYSAQVGSTSATNGDSSISQTFSAPAAGGTLSFWYQLHCPDNVRYDWASATLVDNTTSTTTTILPNTCSNTGWAQSSPAALTGGDTYTLTLLNHDDNYVSDPTYTWYDDVVVTPTTGDFTISASPGTLSVAQRASKTSTVSTTVVGAAGTVSLSASVSPAGPTVSLSPTSVAAGSSSTLTVSADCSVAPGPYTVSVNGAEGNFAHSASVSVTVTTGADFSVSANPYNLSVAQNSTGTSTINTGAIGCGGGTVSLSSSASPSGPTLSLSPTSVSAGSSSTLTVNVGWSVPVGGYTITVTGTEGSSTHTTTVSLTVTPGGIVNGGFETGDFGGWSTLGTTSISASSHTGSFSALVGSTSPTRGDSSITQTFTAPVGNDTISFWYQVHCPDTVTHDWATASLRDNTAGTKKAILPRTCSNSGSWVQVWGSVVAGHSYTLSLVSHDDNLAANPTYTLYDDVSLAADAPLTITAFSATANHLRQATAKATFTDANPIGTASQFSGTISWGDESTSAATFAKKSTGVFVAHGAHTYASSGTYTVTITINDVNGSTVTGTTTLVVT